MEMEKIASEEEFENLGKNRDSNRWVKVSSKSNCECLDRIILMHNIGDFRLISSPNYPDPYCPKMDCKWHIVAPSNSSRIQFSADNLDLRKNMDEIVFYDYWSQKLLENKTENYRCSGDDLCYYTSQFQYLTIRFKSSPMEDIDNFGFQAVVTIRDKFGEIQKFRNLNSELLEF
ncbi:Protein CBG20715 [Caenorhabditis briggsae]|uniref:Protein CBG20715 n=1 Tax=Caenorhabditis briggsae TaxID=6238 RepID=A8XYG1_CAEBR|nr:Protein CBG20715 [Caenorhabditis briggsae]CAP37678.1 Protein CBG20715 [Caenorhabditis briggsae]